jgi:hypothetical protein
VALHIVANRPDPAILRLPWSQPLEDWADAPEGPVVPLPRGLSRHVVRIVRLGSHTYAVKETIEDIAFREYRVLRDLHRIGLPAVVPQGVVSGRTDPDGEPLPAALLTRHLRFSLPYRVLFEQGPTGSNLPRLVDALVVLLVRLHLADFYWGDVSLSNVLFRRDAGGFAAYLVDAETGELKQSISRQLREHDLTVGCENVYGELLDLEESAQEPLDADAIVERIQARYQELWCELTAEEHFSADEMWRVEQRIERLNDLGFDVDELDIVTDIGGDEVRITPRIVELGHHARELRELTGLEAEEKQARRLLNDIAAYTAHHDLGREDRELVANQWLGEVYEPIMAMIPPDSRRKLEPPEIFHEILVHRWFLSENAGREIDIMESARSYFATVLRARPDEVITPPAG